MNVLIDLISREVSGAFEKAGFDPAYGKVTLSNRPDLASTSVTARCRGQGLSQSAHPDRGRGQRAAGGRFDV